MITENAYNIVGDVRSFAVENTFMTRMESGCYAMGQALQPFSIWGNDTQAEWGVQDLSLYAGFLDDSKTLRKDIVDYRREVYINQGMALPMEDVYDKVYLFDYFLSMSICYIEYPKFAVRGGKKQVVYEKGLYTRNADVLAKWLGVSKAEALGKYCSKIGQIPAEYLKGELRAVKCNYTGGGCSASVPKNPIPTENMVCVPLFMINAFTIGVWESLNKKILKFTYLKDNKQARELCSTLDFDILLDYYSDSRFIELMLRNTDIFSTSVGDMQLGARQGRGYIMLPELGCSKYDRSGSRALNLSRLLRIEVLDSVDRSFINVDLDSVLEHFNRGIDTLVVKMADSLPSIALALGMPEAEIDYSSSVLLAEAIKGKALSDSTLFTTTYLRSLHMFMAKNLLWFPNYTGDKVEKTEAINTSGFGVSSMIW